MAVRNLLLFFIVAIKSAFVFGQSSPPPFRELPARAFQFASLYTDPEISHTQLTRFIDAAVNDTLEIAIHPLLQYRGVVTAGDVSLTRTSINVKLLTTPELLFTITRFEEEGLQHYTASILHPKVADALVLRQVNNKYYFKRILTNKLLVE